MTPPTKYGSVGNTLRSARTVAYINCPPEATEDSFVELIDISGRTRGGAMADCTIVLPKIIVKTGFENRWMQCRYLLLITNQLANIQFMDGELISKINTWRMRSYNSRRLQ